MTEAVIFDLDDTLVDTGALRAKRDARRWKECVAAFPQTVIFPGVTDMLAALRERDVRIAVVTSSVSFYAHRLMEHHSISADALIAYHDTQQHKPHPEPVLAALRSLGANARRCLGVGDTEIDATSYRQAGIRAIAAGWSPRCVQSDVWDHFVDNPARFLEILGVPS